VSPGSATYEGHLLSSIVAIIFSASKQWHLCKHWGNFYLAILSEVQNLRCHFGWI